MFLRRFLTNFIAATGLAAAAIAQTTTSTSGTFTQTSTFPPVGVAFSETVQINVVNLASNSSSGTAASCTGTVSFVNAAGATIGTAKPFTIASGIMFSLAVSNAATAGNRVEVRGVITLNQTIGSHVPCTLVSSLETYDTSSGVTHVYLANPISSGGIGLPRL